VLAVGQIATGPKKMPEDRVVAIIEARMSSSRLPGKHLLTAAGKPMLQHLVERLKQVSLIQEIVIATTNNRVDNILVELANRLNVGHHQGGEEDVMGRVIEAGRKYSADIICEVTGDCPIIDPQLVERLIEFFIEKPVVYASNGRNGLPDGMGAQVFYQSTLEKSYQMTKEALDLEHVTLHIRNNRDIFPAVYVAAPRDCYWPALGLTLDEEADYQLLKQVIESFSENSTNFSCSDVVRLLKENPKWVDINAHVVRKNDS